MNNDYVVATLPIKPQQNTNVGMMVAPTIMEHIGNVFNIDKCMSVNLLHTYANKSKELNDYKEYIETAGINYNILFKDDEYTFQLLEIIEKMISSKIISIQKEHIIYCNCGKVDMLKDATNNNGKLYHIENGNIICNCCKNLCHEYEDDVLVLKIKEHKSASISPTFLQKDIKDIEKQFVGKKILVSKKRNTGFKLEIDKKWFNIDIDFIWSNYFKLLNYQNEIFIASNHQLYNMFFINYLSKISSDKKIHFIATPYINGNLNDIKKEYQARKLKEYKLLLLLYNLKWKNKNSKWSTSNYNYLVNISDTKLKNLYEALLYEGKEKQDENIFSNIDNILSSSSNMQKNISMMKKLYKNGYYERNK